MDKFLSGLKNLKDKAGNTLKDIFSVDQGEATPSPLERAGQTVQDWFKKDDYKPIPNDGKAYIAPAPQTTGQKILSTLRSNQTINDILTPIIGSGEDAFTRGKVDGKDYTTGIEALLPRQGEGIIQYLLPEVTKDETTRILDRYDALRAKGVPEERATKVAVEDVRKPKEGSVEAFLAQQRGEKQDITPEEEDALKGTKLREKLGLALDVVGNTPAGFVAKKGEKAVAKKVVDEAVDNPEIFNKASQWVTDWVLGKKVKAPDADVEKFLSQYGLDEPTTVVRGEKTGTQKGLQSWSANLRTAKDFGVESPKGGSTAERTVNPEDVLVDLRKLSGTYGEDGLSIAERMAQNLSKKDRQNFLNFIESEGELIVKKPKTAGSTAETAIKDESVNIPKGQGTMKTAGEVLDQQGGMDRFMKNGGGSGTKAVAEGAGDAGGKTRRFITRTESLAPESKPFLKGKYDPKSNEALIQEADDLIRNSRAEAETIAKTDASDRGVAVASRLLDTLTKEAKTLPEGMGKDATYEKIAEIANETARNLTEAGRSVQAATILGRMTPEGMVRYAARQIQKHNERVAGSTGVKKIGDMFGGYRKKLEKIPELSGEEAKYIQTEMEKIRNITDDIERARAFQAFDKKISQRIPSSLFAKISSVWKAGLLTGLKTTGLNVMSNFTHALTEGAKDVPAMLVDRITSLFTGKRTLALTGKGTAGGVKEGVAKGWDYFKTGFDERDIGGKLDYHHVTFGNGKIAKALQTYEEGVFRFIGSQDQPFYYGAKARSLYSQAIAEAKNKGLYGKEAVDFVNELVANPTDDMVKYATLDAETAVFQNKTTLGQAGRAFQNLPFGEFLLPFAKTPAAVATQLINYSPVGIVKTIAENIGKGKFDQRLFSQGIGRGLTGTGIMYLGSLLYENGMLSLSKPTSEKEQNQWDLEGRQANSIKIGDRWYSISVLGPAGLALLVGGAYRKAYNEAGSVSKGLLQATLGGLKSFNEQTFLKGINQFTNALSDPERYGGTFLSSFVGSWVPTFVADTARAMDDVERRTNGVKERLYSRIPGLRETLEPQVDTFGNEVKTPGALRVMIDATRSKQEIPPDNVTRELRRLMDAGYNTTPTMLGPKSGYQTLTGEQNTKLLKESGAMEKQAIEKLMGTKGYARADDELKSKQIQRVVDNAKIIARARAVYDATSGLSQAQRVEKLKAMRDEKLLTKQVYAYYLSIKKGVNK